MPVQPAAAARLAAPAVEARSPAAVTASVMRKSQTMRGLTSSVVRRTLSETQLDRDLKRSIERVSVRRAGVELMPLMAGTV
jgi:hypothetical protein